MRSLALFVILLLPARLAAQPAPAGEGSGAVGPSFKIGLVSGDQLLRGTGIPAAPAQPCCGQGPVRGPRPATPLELREIPGGPYEVLALPRGSAALARPLLAAMPSLFRVEVDSARAIAQLWSRQPAPAAPEAARVLASAGIRAAPTRLARVRVSGIGRKGALEPIESFLASLPGVAAVETEVEGNEGLARLWCTAAVPQAAIDAAARRVGGWCPPVPGL